MLYKQDKLPKELIQFLTSLKWNVILPETDWDDVIMYSQTENFKFELYGSFSYGMTKKSEYGNIIGESRNRKLKLKLSTKASGHEKSIFIECPDLKKIYDQVWKYEDKINSKILDIFLKLGT